MSFHQAMEERFKTMKQVRKEEHNVGVQEVNKFFDNTSDEHLPYIRFKYKGQQLKNNQIIIHQEFIKLDKNALVAKYSFLVDEQPIDEPIENIGQLYRSSVMIQDLQEESELNACTCTTHPPERMLDQEHWNHVNKAYSEEECLLAWFLFRREAFLQQLGFKTSFDKTEYIKVARAFAPKKTVKG